MGADDSHPKTESDGYFAWSLDVKLPSDDSSSEHESGILARASRFYLENGFVVFTGHMGEADTGALLRAGADIMREFHADDARQEGSSVFTTDDARRVKKDLTFLASSAGIDCFLEDCVDDEDDDNDENGNTGKKQRAVNKIGHAMHDLHADFARVTRTAANRAVVGRVCGLSRAMVVQSMYIVKGARVGGVVNAHRDATFVRPVSGRPADCVGLWWALQDADAGNGCLCVVPGSHADGRAVGKFALRENGTEGHLVEAPDCGYDDAQFVAVPVRAGDAVVLHGGVVHKSARNRSGRSRHAFSVHVVEGGVARDCWLQRPSELPFREL